MFNFSIIVLLVAQVNRKIESDIEFNRIQVTSHVYSRNKGYICVKMMARHWVFVFVFVGLFYFLSSVFKD